MTLAALADFHTADSLVEVLRQALLITGFVFMMMLVIEYLNVLTRGAWQRKLTGHRWGQYFAAALLGATPGCLGAYVVVAMYSHGTITFGAVVAGMIATCGDEAFVMLAQIPRQGLLIIGILFAMSVPLGWLTDRVFGPRRTTIGEHEVAFEVHDEECFARGELLHQWRNCTAARGILAAVLAVFLVAVLLGQMGEHGSHAAETAPAHDAQVASDTRHEESGTEGLSLYITLVVVTVAALFIVATVPDHFLEEHLWKHVAREHVLRVFLWAFGAMLALFVLFRYFDPEQVVHGHEFRWILLGAACLIGLIPQSGPHLVFVFLYADGVIPFSILLANSIVQNGHAPLPLLAYSRRAFLEAKLITFVVGAAVGAALLTMGW